jgi:hypothetical protein
MERDITAKQREMLAAFSSTIRRFMAPVRAAVHQVQRAEEIADQILRANSPEHLNQRAILVARCEHRKRVAYRVFDHGDRFLGFSASRRPGMLWGPGHTRATWLYPTNDLTDTVIGRCNCHCPLQPIPIGVLWEHIATAVAEAEPGHVPHGSITVR